MQPALSTHGGHRHYCRTLSLPSLPLCQRLLKLNASKWSSKKTLWPHWKGLLVTLYHITGTYTQVHTVLLFPHYYGKHCHKLYHTPLTSFVILFLLSITSVTARKCSKFPYQVTAQVTMILVFSQYKAMTLQPHSDQRQFTTMMAWIHNKEMFF